MPATIKPAGRVDAARAPADSTRHSASRRWSPGRGSRRPGRVGSTAATRVAVERRSSRAIRRASAPSGSVTPGNRRAPLESTLPAPIVTPSPSTLSPSTCSRRRSARRRPTMQPLQRAVGADLGALRARRRARSSCRRRPSTPRSSTTRPPMRAPVADPAAALDERRRDDPPGVLDAVARRTGSRRPCAAATPCATVPSRMSKVPCEVALGRADVEPVAVGHVAVEAVADEPREDVALDRGGLLGLEQVEHRALEHVGAGRDVVRVDLVGRGLLDELRRPRRRRACARGRRRTGPRPASARASPRAPVRSCCAIWAVRSMSVSTSPLSIRKRSSSSGSANLSAPPVPSGARLLDVAQPDPERAAVAEHVAHAARPGARTTCTTSSTPWRAQPVEHEGDERPVDERDDRLRDGRGQRPQPRALAAGQDQRLHRDPPPRAAAPARRVRAGRPTPS